MANFHSAETLVRRAEAIDSLRQCFESIEGKPRRVHRQLATDLVQAAWPAVPLAPTWAPDAHPHRLSIAAFALAKGVEAYRRHEHVAEWLVDALGVLLVSVTSKLEPLFLRPTDSVLVTHARHVFLDFGGTLRASGEEAPDS